MKENVLKQMIAAVDEVVQQNKSDFYKYDLHSLCAWETPEFFWSVRKTGTQLLVINREETLKLLRTNEQSRFAFMRYPAQAPYSFLYFPGVKTFHYKDGVFEQVEHPKGAVYGAWNELRKYLQDIITKEFGDKESKYWHSHMRVHFSSQNVWREIYKAVHSDGGESLLQILKSFKNWERCAVDEKVTISGDWSPNSFSFGQIRNGECVMNGGILFYDGKWHRHT